jgi:hypothetical protein
MEIYSIYNIEYIDKEILNSASESLKNINYKEFNHSSKGFIFSPFIDLFNVTPYVPSKCIGNQLIEINYL